MTCRQFHRTAVLGLALIISACTENSESVAQESASRCEALAKARQIDETCAVDIAKREIIARQGNLEYSKFTATYDPEVKAWAVMAAVEPMVPGGHVFISVAPDGAIRDYMLGR